MAFFQDSTPQDHWKVKSLLLPGGMGKELIDVAKCFAVDPDDIASTTYYKNRFIKLPPDTYPPYWDANSITILTNAILTNSLQQTGTQLVRTKSVPRLPPGLGVPKRSKTKSETEKKGSASKHLIFSCRYGNNGGKKDPCKASPVNEEENNRLPSYKPGIKKSHITSKHRGTRGDGKGSGKKEPRRGETCKPTSDCLCKFELKVMLKEGEHWCIPYRDEKHAWHNHPKEKPELMTVMMNRLTEAQQRMSASVHAHAPSGSTQNIVKEMTGHHFSQASLRNNRIKQAVKSGSLPTDCAATSKSSPAQKLMTHLENQKNQGHLSYIAIYHEVQESTFVTISKAKKKLLREKIREQRSKERNEEFVPDEDLSPARVVTPLTPDESEMDPNQSEVASVTESEDSIHLECKHSTPGGQMKKRRVPVEDESSKIALGSLLAEMCEELKVGQNILLACAWCRTDEARMFDAWPEVLMLDVTFQTNSEGRPLGLSVGQDGNVDSFTPVRVFMPSQCQWVFSWIFGTAFPTLLGREALERTQLVLTDGDDKIYKAFDEHQPTIYPNAVHGLCMYHLVTKGLERLSCTSLRHVKDNPECKRQMITFKQWLFNWMTLGGVETRDEFKTSEKLMLEWLAHFSTHTNPDLRHNAVQLEQFCMNKVQFHKKRWLILRRKDKLTLDQRATSKLEACNGVMKVKASKPVTPNMTMLESQMTQDSQCDVRMNKWNHQTFRACKGRPTWVQGSATAHVVNTLCESQLQQHYEQFENYAARMVPSGDDAQPGVVEIVRREGASEMCCQECNSSSYCSMCCEFNPIPQFIRKRTITFAETPDGTGYVVRCTCLYHGITGIPCRHFARVIQVHPDHVNVRHHRAYAQLFGAEGNREWSAFWRSKQRDRRLVITKQQYHDMKRHLQNEMISHDFDDRVFDIPKSQPFQRSPNGMLLGDLVDTTINSDPAVGGVGDGAFVSQDAGLSQEAAEARLDGSEFIGAPILTGNHYNDLNAHMQMGLSNTEGMPEVRSGMVTEIIGVIMKWVNIARQKSGLSFDENDTWVTPYGATDNRRKSKRIKSRFEPNRLRKVTPQKTRLTIANSGL